MCCCTASTKYMSANHDSRRWQHAPLNAVCALKMILLFRLDVTRRLRCDAPVVGLLLPARACACAPARANTRYCMSCQGVRERRGGEVIRERLRSVCMLICSAQDTSFVKRAHVGAARIVSRARRGLVVCGAQRRRSCGGGRRGGACWNVGVIRLLR